MRSMRAYLIRKVFYLLITIIMIMSFNFLIFKLLPGDPITLLFPRGATPETLEYWNHALGYDKPLLDQYLWAIIAPFVGDFGISVTYTPRVPISDILAPYLVKTLFLVGLGTVITIFVGIYVGRESAWRRGKLYDKVATSISVILYSVPTFLTAIFLIIIFAFWVPGWPLGGATSPIERFERLDTVSQILDLAHHALLPLFALVIGSIAGFSLIVRSSLIDVLTEDYILTAEAKGLDNRTILRKHAMPNAYLPLVATVALNVGWVLGGTIMIEYIFTYKGLGYLGWEAILCQDFPLLQTVFFLEVVAVVFANFIADILNFYIDPRIKI